MRRNRRAASLEELSIGHVSRWRLRPSNRDTEPVNSPLRARTCEEEAYREYRITLYCYRANLGLDLFTGQSPEQ